MLPVSLDCPFLIAPSIYLLILFSAVYNYKHYTVNKTHLRISFKTLKVIKVKFYGLCFKRHRKSWIFNVNGEFAPPSYSDTCLLT
jgi:hypothetical protein